MKLRKKLMSYIIFVILNFTAKVTLLMYNAFAESNTMFPCTFDYPLWCKLNYPVMQE